MKSWWRTPIFTPLEFAVELALTGALVGLVWRFF